MALTSRRPVGAYTRRLIALFAEAGVPLEMTTVHADTPTLLANQAADRRHEQATIFADLSDRLAKAGAEVVAITSIAGHFCRSEFAQQSALPVLDMIEAVARDVADRGYDRVSILGTRTVMDTRFYDALPSIADVDLLEMIAHTLHRLAENPGLLDGRQTCRSAVLAQGHLQRLALRGHRAPHAARHRLGGRSKAEA